MKIAQFTGSLIEPLGGAEQYCLALARHQAANGDDVTVFTGWVDDSVAADLEADGISVVVLPTSRPYAPDLPGTSLLLKLKFHARELLDSVRRTPAAVTVENGGFDVVHVHRFAGFGTAPLRLRGVKVVHTVHDYTLVDTSASLVRNGRLRTRPSIVQRARTAVVTAGIPRSTTLVFPSIRTRDRHTDFGFATSRYDSRVISHGWSSSAPTPVSRPTDRPFTVLFLGKLAPHKGLPLLLEAWGDGIPGAVLRIAGDGELAAEIAANPAVTALGWLGEAERTRELCTADVLAFPSAWPENFPIVVAESMLAGVPVLTTTIASPPLVDHEESGLLVEPTADAFRSAIVRLAGDADLRCRLQGGTALRAEELDMSAHGARLSAVYSGDRATAGVS